MTATLIFKEIFVPSPRPQCGVFGLSYYTQATGSEVVGIHQHISSSDTIDVAYVRRSPDDGRTWSSPQEVVMAESREDGVLRRFLFPGYVDDATGRLLTVRMEGLIPHDKPKERTRPWQMFYSVSEDGGETFLADEMFIEDGTEYNEEHPFPGVWRGKNSVQRGAFSCVPLTLPDGTILVPCQGTHIGANGEYSNPGGGMSYHDSMVLRGRWRSDGGLNWQISERIIGDPQRTTRGMIEPTLGLLGDGRVLIVLRGSNDANPDLPGTKWHSFSTDGGATWSTPEPWTFDNGKPFYSPSSCSQLLRHSSGRLLWLGNISPTNPKGNSPRYPLIMAEVDDVTGLLMQDSVQVLDDRKGDDDETLQLSNFYAREDRETGEILLHLTRVCQKKDDIWTADALLYRFAVRFS